jgi:hypothetical protein
VTGKAIIEIIEMYEEGVLPKADVLSKLTDVAAANGVEHTLQILPEPWTKDLEKWIFDVYDNEVHSDDFLSFGDPEPDLELRRRDIAILREWIATRKATRSL